VILETLNPHVTSVLAGHGFQKFGKRNPAYHRPRDERVEIIDIRGNDYNTKTEGSFTVNVAVFFPTLDPFVSSHPVRERPESYQCPIQYRLDTIDTDGRPTHEQLLPVWWEFGPTIDPVEVGTRVATEIEARALTFFDRFAPRPVLLEALRSGTLRASAEWTAAIAAWAGDRAYAEQALARAVAETAKGKALAMLRRRAVIVAEALEFTPPEVPNEEHLKVTLRCPADATRDETDQAYFELYSGLMRQLPDDGPDYLFHVESVVQGITEAELYGPDRAALIERIQPVLSRVAALKSGNGNPQWTVS
jgi:Domain of unknown function (DUF4304)